MSYLPPFQSYESLKKSERSIHYLRLLVHRLTKKKFLVYIEQKCRFTQNIFLFFSALFFLSWRRSGSDSSGRNLMSAVTKGRGLLAPGGKRCPPATGCLERRKAGTTVLPTLLFMWLVLLELRVIITSGRRRPFRSRPPLPHYFVSFFAFMLQECLVPNHVHNFLLFLLSMRALQVSGLSEEIIICPKRQKPASTKGLEYTLFLNQSLLQSNHIRQPLLQLLYKF